MSFDTNHNYCNYLFLFTLMNKAKWGIFRNFYGILGTETNKRI